MIYTGRQVHAEEAHRIGFVNAVYPLDQLMPVAQEMAARIARNSPAAVRAAKNLIALISLAIRQRVLPPRWRASAPPSPRPTGARACAPSSRSGQPVRRRTLTAATRHAWLNVRTYEAASNVSESSGSF